MSANGTTGSSFGPGAEDAVPNDAGELRRRMSASAEGFLASAAWVPWKTDGEDADGSVAHVVIRERQFVPVFTDPSELRTSLPGLEARAMPMAELVTALPEEFGIVVDPTSAQAANFLQADVIAGLRAGMSGTVPLEAEAD
ncbi:SseB family protein [Curtobacterium sp. MCPF17_050]|uniref:SseB family protein n=1 Tax=Curtobacterium sp. MCPF17_050 TaxID=2175664 RepID=UPI000D8BE339|nr:SseB family protein [Curtobacterium sp. MCPF17_050]WIB16651.1 SseB family protein [Curtobacterium sp. MCPF17_050]